MSGTDRFGVLWTPFNFVNGRVEVWEAKNYRPGEGTDVAALASTSFSINRTTVPGSWETWAVWSVAAPQAAQQVPESSTFFMFLSSLLIGAVCSYRKLSL